MWDGKTVTVVLMTYDERESIRRVIEDFEATGLVDEILVVNNNAAKGTSEEVAGTSAREVFETKQGYGNAIQRGFLEASGDLIVLAEPDGTFLARDVVKLLAYSGEVDAVFGTRTTREMIWQGANMGFLLKWGNWAVAKMIELIFNTSHLSDVGCTYKLFRRDLAAKLAGQMSVGGSHAGPELMLLTISGGYRFVEIPVNYLPRVGRSSVTGHPLRALTLGLTMIGHILHFRLRRTARPR